MRAVEHAGPVERRVRVLRALHVQLVAGRPVEGAARVGADLGAHVATRAAGRRRAARRSSSTTSRWTSTLPRPRRCARPATWNSPESSASRSHSLAGAIAGELLPQVLRERRHSPRARAAGACSRCRRSRTGRGRPPRRPGGTGRRCERWLRAQKPPAARAAPGAPASAASSPYVTTSPRGTVRSAAAQRVRNGVSYSRSTGTSSSGTLLAREVRLQKLHDFRRRSLDLRVTRSVIRRKLALAPGGWGFGMGPGERSVPSARGHGSSCQTTRPSATTSSPTPQPSTS